MQPGLAGETLRKCSLQYGSTLRNLGRIDDSHRAFRAARESFPDSESLVIFEALTLHAAGRVNSALAGLVELIADRDTTTEVTRYEAAIRVNAAYLSSLDAQGASGP